MVFRDFGWFGNTVYILGNHHFPHLLSLSFSKDLLWRHRPGIWRGCWVSPRTGLQIAHTNLGTRHSENIWPRLALNGNREMERGRATVMGMIHPMSTQTVLTLKMKLLHPQHLQAKGPLRWPNLWEAHCISFIQRLFDCFHFLTHTWSYGILSYRDLYGFKHSPNLPPCAMHLQVSQLRLTHLMLQLDCPALRCPEARDWWLHSPKYRLCRDCHLLLLTGQFLGLTCIYIYNKYAFQSFKWYHYLWQNCFAHKVFKLTSRCNRYRICTCAHAVTPHNIHIQ